MEKHQPLRPAVRQMPDAQADIRGHNSGARHGRGTIHLRQLPANKGDDMKRIYRWLHAMIRADVIGSRIGTYDRACIRAAEAYDRQDRYLRSMERQS